MPMDAERWQRVRAIFEAAAARPAGERVRYLDEACGGDTELRAEVESLLAHDVDGGGTIDRVVADAVAGVASPSLSGRQLGPYRLLGELGQGGMGSVWLAVRADGTYEREVAIKLVRGLPSRQLVERFEAERRILATLDHPNIARLLDAGATEDGSPYVVMEYVDGVPIDRYCDEQGLDLRGRLALFLEVCAAVEHAHRGLIVHRDIKPGNILVDGNGTPKLLDFGIAKLLDPAAVDGPAVETASAMRLLTPEYASPEQVLGRAITTATDVYSLGVLLYALLAGRLPHRVTSERQGELERAICETEPASMAGRVDGELENVVRTALRKEPERRYGSVGRLAEDVRCYLDGRPVSARPATWAYRGRKFVSRNRVAVTVAVAVVSLIAATIGFYTYRLAEQRDVARQERAAAEEVTAFLVGLFKLAGPEQTRGRTITAEEILHSGAQRIRNELSERPLLRARLLYTIGQVYDSLGLYAEAEELVRESVELRGELLEEDDLDLADSLNVLAQLRYRAGDYGASRDIMERLVRIQEKALGPRDRKVGMLLNNLAILDKRLGDYESARARYERSLDILEEVLEPGDAMLGRVANNLALVYEQLDEYDRALALFQRSLEQKERALGADHPDLLTTLNNLANALVDTGDYDRARETFERALALGRKTLGDDHPEVGSITHNYGILLHETGDLDGCEALFERALEILLAAHGSDSPRLAGLYQDLGQLRRDQGRPEEAADYYARSLRLREATLGPDHPDTRSSRDGYVSVLRALGRGAEADAIERP